MKKSRPPLPRREADRDGGLTRAEPRKPTASQTVWQGLATVGSVGFTLVGCTFLGLLAGYNLDRWLKTRPWFTIVLLIVGIAAGFINIFASSRSRLAPRSGPPARQKDSPPDETAGAR